MQKFYLYRNAWRFDGASSKEQKLQKDEWKTLLKQGGLMVRNTYNFDCSEETCFWYVIKDHFNGFDELTPRVRNKVRHAFHYFEYRLISFDTMWEKTYPIIADTFADYPIHDRTMNQGVYEQYLSHCKERTFDYWGIFDKSNGQMVGFCTVNLWGNCCEYGVTGILSKYKRNGYYPYYGLLAVKMLYPFRKIIPLQRVKAILNMEAMQRGEK